MRRALAVAQTVAAEPQVAQSLLTTRPTPGGPLRAEAERIRLAADASCVVVTDTRGTGWSHTDTARIGEHVSTAPSTASAKGWWRSTRTAGSGWSTTRRSGCSASARRRRAARWTRCCRPGGPPTCWRGGPRARTC
ncbi:hypothetical protein [Streptomyces sp. IBSBF 2435]|uniref:hypothetical protein n=1 Tax=Streptomyces sp. IBSBF 2435 TaxID=2903531 RepID=UPI003FA782CC